jgi:hypothetical protein
MHLSSVILARALAYVEAFDLVPRGNVFYPDFARAVAERYSFLKYPQTLEQFDELKGVEFVQGKSKGTVIQKLTIFTQMLTIETRVSTDESKRILEEMLLWASEKFKLNYAPNKSIQHFAYVSSLTFYSDAQLLAPMPAIARLAAKTGDLVSDIWKERIEYDGLQIAVGHDPLARKYGMASFYIARRTDAKFSEHKYFSEAPLPTHDHLRLLEEYEHEVRASIGNY